VPHRRPGEEKAPVEVDRGHPPPVLQLQLGERRDVLDPGIAHRNVQPPESPHRIGHSPIHLLLPGDVHRQCDGLPAPGANALRRSLGRGPIDVGDRHRRPLGGEGLGHRPTQPAASASHQCHPTFEPHVRTSLGVPFKLRQESLSRLALPFPARKVAGRRRCGERLEAREDA
jgi:hypothetical protein